MDQEIVFDILSQVEEGAPLTLDMVAAVFGPAIYELVDARIAAHTEADGQ